jgi:hypothetical protein
VFQIIVEDGILLAAGSYEGQVNPNQLLSYIEDLRRGKPIAMEELSSSLFKDKNNDITKKKFVKVLSKTFGKTLTATGLRCFIYDFFYNEPQKDAPRPSQSSKWLESNGELVQRAYRE